MHHGTKKINKWKKSLPLNAKNENLKRFEQGHNYLISAKQKELSFYLFPIQQTLSGL